MFGYKSYAEYRRYKTLATLDGWLLSLLIVIGIPVLIIWFIISAISSGISSVMTSCLMPTYERTKPATFYSDGIQDRYKEFSKKYMFDNQIESWKQFGLIYDKQAGRGFQCSVSEIDNSQLKDKDINKFDIWYKTQELSIVQTVICINTEFYNNGIIRKDSKGQDFIFKQYFLIRSKMYARRNSIFVKYTFEPEHIQLIYQNYDLEKLSSQL